MEIGKIKLVLMAALVVLGYSIASTTGAYIGQQLVALIGVR